MAAHAEPCDGHVVLANREVSGDHMREFFCDVGEHLIMLSILLTCCVHIVTSGAPHSPIISAPRDVGVTGASIREDYCKAMFAGVGSEAGFGREVVMGAGEATQAVQSGERFAPLVMDFVVGEVDVEGHEAVGRVTPVSYFFYHSPFTFELLYYLYLHVVVRFWRGLDLHHSSQALSPVQSFH